KIVTVLALAGAATLLVSLWVERRTEVTLPVPTGPFAIGRAVYDWTDPTTLDVLSPVAGAHRELLIWIWYPSPGQAVASQEYLPVQVRDAVQRHRGGLFGALTRNLSKVRGHSMGLAT